MWMYIASLMEKRRALYAGACDISVSTDGKTPEQIAMENSGGGRRNVNIKSGKGLLVYECITDRRIWKPDQQFDCEI